MYFQFTANIVLPSRKDNCLSKICGELIVHRSSSYDRRYYYVLTISLNDCLKTMQIVFLAILLSLDFFKYQFSQVPITFSRYF